MRVFLTIAESRGERRAKNVPHDERMDSSFLPHDQHARVFRVWPANCKAIVSKFRSQICRTIKQDNTKKRERMNGRFSSKQLPKEEATTADFARARSQKNNNMFHW